MQAKEQKIHSNLSQTALGLYVHVPFCASTCDFCAFYQEKPKKDDIERYFAGIEQELQQLSLSRPLSTIFWGGGTPGLLSAKDLEHLGGLIHKYCDCSQLKEWSIEMAPSTVKADKISTLKDLGVTRISMGVQSFKDSLLQELGRLHRPNQIYQAYEILQKAEFPNINLDFIFAIPNQTIQDWMQDMQEAIRLAPNHISTYCLTFEEDTALYIKLSKGKVKINLDHEADLYLQTWDFLKKAGYYQYEISNFTRSGFECKHNLDTWHMQEWVGIGPSASSQYQGKRYTNPSSIPLWLEGLKTFPQLNPHLKDVIELDPFNLALDYIIFGLRLNDGVNLDSFKKRFSFFQTHPTFNEQRLFPILLHWEEIGLIEFQYPCFWVTDKGRLIADELAIEIMNQLSF